MLFPVQRLLEGKDRPLCISRHEPIERALELMLRNDFSQLPVIDDNGNLAGLISEHAIVETYYYVTEGVSLFDLDVSHALVPTMEMSPEDDLFEALDRMRDDYAVVITDNQKPVGILTHYDTTQFFRDLSEGLIFAEDIEVTLRGYIESIFRDDHAMTAALLQALGADKQEPTKPRKLYEELSFAEHIQLIVAESSWPRFERVLEPKKLFVELMRNVGEIRNQLAHFRGRLDPLQRTALDRARTWLANRPQVETPVAITKAPTESELARVTGPSDQPHKIEGRYAELTDWLLSMREQETVLRVTIDDLENLVDFELPDIARRHRSWWANDPAGGVQASAWMEAGWKVEAVDFSNNTVTFRRSDSVFYQLFFADLLDRLKEKRPNLTRAKKTYPQNWWNFSGGRTGFYFGWVFASGGKLRAELYIDVGEKAANKQAFELLHSQKSAIEEEIGAELTWQRLPDARASRLFLSHPVTVVPEPEKTEELKEWSLRSLLAMVDSLRPRVRALQLQDASAKEEEIDSAHFSQEPIE